MGLRTTLIIAIVTATLSAAGGAYGASLDPFGSHGLEPAYGPVREKWLATIDKLARDRAVFAACIDSTVIGCAAAQRLGAIIEDAKAQSGLAVLGHINRSIDFEIKPVAPSDWLSPLEAMNDGGDCKAYSLAKYFALSEAGIAADHLRLVIVHVPGQSGNHMVVAALWQERWLILDNLTLTLVPDELSEYVPLLVFDDKDVRSYTFRAVAY